jgi:hypothetical protein
MNTYDMIRRWRESNGVEYALESLVQMHDRYRNDHEALYVSRFFERVKEHNENVEPTGRKYLQKVTEKYISDCIDMADCYDREPQEFLYNDDDGELYPVTVGEMARCEMDEHQVVYGHSDLIANGKGVGTVTYTDH